jgi:hypothetical protein
MHSNVQTERGATRRFTDEMVGYEARADGPIGKVERVTFDGEWAIVATGRVKKHRHAVPAWAIRVVDVRNEAVLLGLTKDEIAASPPYDETIGVEDEQAEHLRSYYDGLLSGRPRVRAA